LQPETLEALQQVSVGGKIADVYLQFAQGEASLRAYLQMERCLQEGSLDSRELEAVKLWVSQQTGCDFCLSVHSFKAGKAGLNQEQQIQIRSGKPVGDQRIDMLLKVASVVYSTPGSIPQALFDEALASGLSQSNLVDLTMAMATIFFTNITNHINDSRSAFPAAKAI
jgi:AhpD family alkylhydroperoxidase